MGLGKVEARRAIRVDDAFGEKIENSFSAMLGHVGGEDVIEAAIFTNDDDDMLNRDGGLDGTDQLPHGRLGNYPDRDMGSCSSSRTLGLAHTFRMLRHSCQPPPSASYN